MRKRASKGKAPSEAWLFPVCGLFCGQRRKPKFKPAKIVEKASKTTAFRLKSGCFVELLPRFELGTSSLPITTFTFCSVSHCLQSLINQGFLCHIFCFGSSLGVTFHSVSPQIHPKPAYAAFGRSFFCPKLFYRKTIFSNKTKKNITIAAIL